MIQGGDPKGNGTGGQSIWHGKDNTKDTGTGFKNENFSISPIISMVSLSMANTKSR